MSSRCIGILILLILLNIVSIKLFCSRKKSTNTINFDKINKRKLEKTYEIILKLSNIGYQNILNPDFNKDADKISLIYNNTETIYCNSCRIVDINDKNIKVKLTWNLLDNETFNCDKMFTDLNNIEEIDLKGFETSKINSGFQMFKNCTSLRSIYFKDNNFKNIETMEQMFEDCNSLKSLNLSNADLSKVKSTENMFKGCKSLISLDFNDIELSSVTTMKKMFSECTNLNILNLKNLYTYNLNNINYMFDGCSNLKELNINNFYTANVKTMEGVFRNCISLSSLNLESFKTRNVLYMNDMFKNCYKLNNLTISDFDFTNVIHMNNMFSGCSSLTSIDIDLKNAHVENIYQMFYGCEKLISLKMINFNMTNIKNYSNLFYDCANLEYINFNNSQNINNNIAENIFEYIKFDAVICINENNILYKYIENSKCMNIDCSKNWKLSKKKYIKEADLYIDNCNMNYYFTYVYDNQCYEKCPNGTYIHKDNNYLSINNYNDSLEYKNRNDEINKDETDEANTECDPLSYFGNLCNYDINNNSDKIINETFSANFIKTLIEDIHKGLFQPLFNLSIVENKALFFYILKLYIYYL